MAGKSAEALGKIGQGRGDGKLDPITLICMSCKKVDCAWCLTHIIKDGFTTSEPEETFSSATPINGKRIA